MEGGTAAVTVAARPNQSVFSCVCEARRRGGLLYTPRRSQATFDANLFCFFLILFNKKVPCLYDSNTSSRHFPIYLYARLESQCMQKLLV